MLAPSLFFLLGQWACHLMTVVPSQEHWNDHNKLRGVFREQVKLVQEALVIGSILAPFQIPEGLLADEESCFPVETGELLEVKLLLLTSLSGRPVPGLG